jgi:hypothetical protein
MFPMITIQQKNKNHLVFNSVHNIYASHKTYIQKDAELGDQVIINEGEWNGKYLFSGVLTSIGDNYDKSVKIYRKDGKVISLPYISNVNFFVLKK